MSGDFLEEVIIVKLQGLRRLNSWTGGIIHFTQAGVELWQSQIGFVKFNQASGHLKQKFEQNKEDSNLSR